MAAATAAGSVQNSKVRGFQPGIFEGEVLLRHCRLPSGLEVEENIGATFKLRCSINRLFGALKPCVVLRVVPPCRPIQFLGRQILLIGALLEVEDEKEGFRVITRKISGIFRGPVRLLWIQGSPGCISVDVGDHRRITSILPPVAGQGHKAP